MDKLISRGLRDGEQPIAAVYLDAPAGGHWKYTLNLYQHVQSLCVLVTVKDMELQNHWCAPILSWSPGPHVTLLSKIRLFRDHFFNLGRFLRIAKKTGVKILHFQSFEPISLFFFLPWLKNDFLLMFSVHNVLPHRYYSKWTKTLELKIRKRIYQRADHLFVFSRYGMDLLEEEFHIPKQRIQLLPMGCHEPLPKDPPRRLELPPEPTFLMFGGYRVNKGFEVLREAFLSAKRAGLPGKLMLAGKYPQEIADRTIDLFAAGGIQDQLILINRFIEEEEIDQILRSSDFILLPYTSFASQSGIIFLAYAYNLPVIASRAGGLSEVIQEDGTGILVHPADVNALEEALFQGIREWNSLVSRDGPKLLETKYAWSRIGSGTDRTYRLFSGITAE